jgi:hypothetical protein
MSDAPAITHPLLRLGQLHLPAGLRAFQPATDGQVVTAAVPVPVSSSELQNAWDVAWADAARQAGQLGADQATAQALPAGAGDVQAGGTRIVVAQGGAVLLAETIAADAPAWVRVGRLPRLVEAAAAVARRPAYVVVLASREGTDVIAHAAGDLQPPQRFPAGDRPGTQPDPHPGRPPSLHHGERHLTDREPESGGQLNDEYIAGKVDEAARSVGAHIVLGSGDQHILDAVAAHLSGSLGPIARLGSGDLAAAEGAALDEITAAAIAAVGDRVEAGLGGDSPTAVRGVAAVADQLAQEQVAVLLVAADTPDDPASGYRIGSRASELVTDADTGVEVPLDDGLVWAALAQDAIVIQRPDRTGPLGGEPVAALLRRGQAG